MGYKISDKIWDLYNSLIFIILTDVESADTLQKREKGYYEWKKSLLVVSYYSWYICDDRRSLTVDAVGSEY